MNAKPALRAIGLFARPLLPVLLGTLLITSGRSFAQSNVPSLAGVAHVAIRVHDLAAARDFYAKLGYQEAFNLAKDGHRAVIVSCLDNLLKGAAGQAVQNLNVMQGWGEAEGLE